MPTQEQSARFFAWNNPKRDGGTWDQWCASLMYRYNRASTSYINATAAGDAAQPLNPNHTQAPIGAVHYWGQGDGHVAQDMRGRGSMLFMASRRVTESLGDAIGMISFDDYQNATGLPYRGWAMRYGRSDILNCEDNGTFKDQPKPNDNDIKRLLMSNTAAIVVGYVDQAVTGKPHIVLLYPDGTAVRLNETQDVNAACSAHASIYGLQRTISDQALAEIVDSGRTATASEYYGAQLDSAQWAWAWTVYPGKKIGF